MDLIRVKLSVLKRSYSDEKGDSVVGPICTCLGDTAHGLGYLPKLKRLTFKSGFLKPIF